MKQPSKEDRRYNQVELSRSRANIKALKAENSILSLDKLVLESKLAAIEADNKRLRELIRSSQPFARHVSVCDNHDGSKFQELAERWITRSSSNGDVKNESDK